ncbi:hypothetical protein FJT64_013851 [Amphibalanus amphitrite]|uniref:Sushi domain-containing protein n=1 Tax=Amphibalanus amphitrite TaxID=1232801 RepID=A0A6A4VBJ4_AMPAM|nr:hypothetical protein FJT64_013851 [Amphibalanus amphitrite]
MRRAVVSTVLTLLLAAPSVAITVRSSLRLTSRWERRTAGCQPVSAHRSGLSRLGCSLLALGVEAWGWRYDPAGAPADRCQLCWNKPKPSDNPPTDTFLRGEPHYTGVSGFCHSPDQCTLENGECGEDDRCHCLPGFDHSYQCLHTCFLKYDGFRAETAPLNATNATVTLDCAADGSNDLLTGLSVSADGRLEAVKCPQFANGLQLGARVVERPLGGDNITNPVTTRCPKTHVVTGLTAAEDGSPQTVLCRPLQHLWVIHSKTCVLQPVSAAPLSEQQLANASIPWPTQCDEEHQRAVKAVITWDGVLGKILCCRIMEDCSPLK